jgi:hypothetical protein
VHLQLSRPLLGRGLRILQAVFDEAERRGWEVAEVGKEGYLRRAGVAIVVGRHAYRVELHEQTETVPFTPDEIRAWRERESRRRIRSMDGSELPGPQLKRKRATGWLGLMLPDGYEGGRAHWREGPRGPLEGKLGSVFRTLEERAGRDDVRAQEAAARRHELRLAEERRVAQARLERVEAARAERLVSEVAAWERSERVLRYVKALEGRLPQLPDEDRGRVQAWCEWALRFAHQTDPVRNPSLVVGLDGERDGLFRSGWRGIGVGL